MPAARQSQLNISFRATILFRLNGIDWKTYLLSIISKVGITKIFTFEMAHALINYDGKSKNIHGHFYKLEVTVIGLPTVESSHPQDGLLIDFSDLKRQ